MTRGAGSVGFAGFAGWILGPSNLRKGPTNPRILNIEPKDFGVSGEPFTDSRGVSGEAGRFLGFGNEILRGGGWKLALLCNGRVIFEGGDGVAGGSDDDAAWDGGGVVMGVHVRFLEIVSYGWVGNGRLGRTELCVGC